MIEASTFKQLIEIVLKCPICGCECCHIASVDVRQDSQIVRVTRYGPAVNDDSGSSGRGSSVYVNLWCEEGHKFTVRYWFHKGTTSVEVVETGNYRSDNGEQPGELWRD